MHPDAANYNIMIVDDDLENLRVLGTMLKGEGYGLRFFPSGPQALKSAAAELPDLILLDVRMPHMDGFEVCRLLKNDATLRDVPVLFLSASDEIEDKVQAFSEGAVDYITKPFQADEVLSRVKTHLSLRKAKHRLKLLNADLENRIRKRTEELKESEKKYRLIVTTTNEGIVTTDETLRIVYANPTMALMMGRSVEEIEGRNGLDFIPEEDRDRIRTMFEERKTGTSHQYEGRIVRADGQNRWVRISAAPIMGNDGQFQGTIALLSDITDSKNAQYRLEAAYQEISVLKRQLETDNAYLMEEIKLEHDFEHIVGNSDAIQYVLFRLEQVAQTDSTVIFLGETGTGKELFARALHGASSRSNRPLIKMDCATLSENLIESELFGHVKGAFTGADRSRQGRFELANNGTIFLDEIGELPLPLQTKLLRVLQDGQFERLGDNRTLKTDARIITATNRDLEALVKGGQFRDDLWYRLKVFPITLPPLRERKTDIPLLVNHFVQRIGKRIGKEIRRIPASVMVELTEYHWPGNVRELKHVLERSIIISEGESLSLYEPLVPESDHSSSTKVASHAEMERNHILRVLEQTRWVVEGPKGAARILKLHPNTLRYRMKKHGIRRPH